MRKSDLLLGFRYKPLEMGFVVYGSVWGHRTANLPLFFVSDAIRGYFCLVCVYVSIFLFPLVVSLKKKKVWTRDCLEEQTLHLSHFRNERRLQKHSCASFYLLSAMMSGGILGPGWAVALVLPHPHFQAVSPSLISPGCCLCAAQGWAHGQDLHQPSSAHPIPPYSELLHYFRFI